MQYFTYTLGQTQPHDKVAEHGRSLFGRQAQTGPARHVDPGDTWPQDALGILVCAAPEDTSGNIDPQANAWIEAAAAGQRLELVYRSVRIVWKSGRALVVGPSGLVDAALSAILDYALLSEQMRQIDEQAMALGHALAAWQGACEAGKDLAPLRAQLAQATQLSLRLVDLRPYCDLPARTGDASPAMRLRTELLTQAQTSDTLGLFEHRLELVCLGLENRLQRTGEAKRGQWELGIGITIVVILVIEFFTSLALELFHN